jgi:hypothetical protein
MVEPVTGAWYILNLLNYTDQNDTRLPDPTEPPAVGTVFSFPEELSNGTFDFIQIEDFDVANDAFDLMGDSITTLVNTVSGALMIAGDDGDAFVFAGVSDADQIDLVGVSDANPGVLNNPTGSDLPLALA